MSTESKYTVESAVQAPMYCGHMQTLPAVVSDRPWYYCDASDGVGKAMIEPPFYHGRNDKPFGWDPLICSTCNRCRIMGLKV